MTRHSMKDNPGATIEEFRDNLCIFPENVPRLPFFPWQEAFKIIADTTLLMARGIEKDYYESR